MNKFSQEEKMYLLFNGFENSLSERLIMKKNTSQGELKKQKSKIIKAITDSLLKLHDGEFAVAKDVIIQTYKNTLSVTEINDIFEKEELRRKKIKSFKEVQEQLSKIWHRM